MDTPLLALTRRHPGSLPGRSPRDAAVENMRQLVQLRWLAVLGQLIAILIAHFGLRIDLPLASMLAIVAALGGANLAFVLTLRRAWFIRGELFLALLLDMAALTAQLYLSGGSGNPFVSLYLLQVALGAILLRPAQVWVLVAASCLCVALLSVDHLPLILPPELAGVAAEVGLAGSWISFAMVAVLLVLFVNRISHNLRSRDTFVAELRQRAAEEDGIVRMGLFASGAAHELGTPLSTIDVVLSDWARNPALDADPELREELEVARSELQRCKQIVANILHSAGQARGEAMSSLAVRTLLDDVAAEWQAAHPAVALDYRPIESESARIAAEPALRQAIWSLLENAAEASPAGIALSARLDVADVVIAVEDRGPGFPDTQLPTVGRLYQSSKGPGHGLGLFLAGNVARRLGGRLVAENSPMGGAVVRLILPSIEHQGGDLASG